ncbi:MAG TPA: DUF1501 domain-containing protein [Blastocatellia bacterium]|nr:DUF1501 domain-containing protein [Blastocatellia bacterium]
MPITRRQFIKRGAAAVTVGMVVPRLWLSEARGQQVELTGGRRFVIIQLAGGNDGLNTVVPYADARYAALRPTLAWKEAELKTAGGAPTIISDQFGLHPALAEVKQLYDAGRVAVVLGVGYPNGSLSHFLSMDIWHTADLSGLASRGWLGRFADIALVGQSPLSALSIGSLDTPKTFFATRFVVPNILNLSLYNFLTDPAYPGDYNNQLNAFNVAASRAFAADTLMGAVNKTAFESVSGAQHVQQAARGYQSSVAYPADNPLAVGLKLAAQLMTTVPEAAILYVKLDGFDHHADQIANRNGQPNRLAGNHFNLLRWLSQAVMLFHDDLSEHGLADNTVIMQWSEFGRRPGENACASARRRAASPSSSRTFRCAKKTARWK